MKKTLQEESSLTKRPRVVCKDCKKRSPGCHSECQDYISFRKELKEYNEQIRKESDISTMWFGYKRDKQLRRR